jgi:outer membrane protein assembly factor BamB
MEQQWLTCRRGSAAVDLEHRFCVIDNVSNGFDLYNLDLGSFIRTLPTGELKRSYPRGVTFADRFRAIIGGSDHGNVYIFDQNTGLTLRTLKHARTGGAETIAVNCVSFWKESWRAEH